MMSWIRRHPRGAILYALVVLLCLAVTAPMRVAFGSGGGTLSARAAEGSVFSGVLRDVSVGGAHVGDLGAEMNPLGLALLQLRYHLFRPASPGIAAIETRLTRAPGRVAIAGLTGPIGVDGVSAALPVATLEFDGFDADFSAAGCTQAAGMVRARPSAGLPGVDLTNGLAGTARCEGSAMLLPLVSQSGLERLTLRITADGRYSGDLSLDQVAPETALALSAMGFPKTPRGYRLRVSGTL